MFSAIASVLSLIVQPCYALTGNWWIAILLFTIITKVILLPMSLWCQKNSIVMVKLMPELNRIKIKYFGDRETIGEKQSALYKEKHYHPLLSLIPLAVQVIILFGLVDVIHSITDHGAPGTEFLGLVPYIDGGLSWIMPVLAGLSAVLMGCAQNAINPLQKEQSRAEKNMTNGLSIGLSLVLGVFVAAGMCFYWVCSNLLAIIIQVLCNMIIVPRKHIDYEGLDASRNELAKLNELDAERKTKWYKSNPQAKREKADYKRFFNIVNKHIVFYSEGSGYYKYFVGAIEWLLENSDVRIHYVTNDPDDQIFGIAERQPRIRPYYIGQKRAITLMMKMDADIVVTTLEDLDNYYIKRSYVRHDIEYILTFHHMTSTHLTAQKKSYDNYDTLFCVGPHQVAELRRAEELYGLPAKTLVECGYDLLDRERAEYESLDAGSSADQDSTACGPAGCDEPDFCAAAPMGDSAARSSAACDPAGCASAARSSTACGPAGCASVVPAPTACGPADYGSATPTSAVHSSATPTSAVHSSAAPAPTIHKPIVLVAPSWQEDCIPDSCIDELLSNLLGHGWQIIVRPHPEYTKRFRSRWDAILARYADVPEDELYFEKDFSSNRTVFTSDVLITDWSTVACEFSFTTKKPSIFIDTLMKVGNPDWEELGIEPTDISMRNRIGVSLAPERIGEITGVVEDILEHPDLWSEKVCEVRDEFIFNHGHAAEVAGAYLLERMLAKQEEKKGEGERHE